MLRWALDAAAATGARPIVVLSPDTEAAARELLPGGTLIAIQPAMRGTGDAVRVAI